MAVRDALVALAGLFDNVGADDDLLAELAELLANRRTPDTGDTATVAAESVSVYRRPGAADGVVGTLTYGTALRVWRSQTVGSQTWCYVSETGATAAVAGWLPADWLTITEGSRPAVAYEERGDFVSAVTLAKGMTINESGGDHDTRAEGDTDPNLLFLDASTDRMGVGTATPAAKFQVVGAARVGATGDYTALDATGHQTMAGEGRPWRDELGELLGKKRKGTRISEDLDEGVLLFSDTCALADDWVITNVQLNHDKDLTASLYPHLHWLQAAAAVPNWLLAYRWQINGGAKTTTWTRAKYTALAFSYSAGAILQIVSFPEIAVPTGAGLSDIVQFRLCRDTGNASGLFTGSDPLSGNAAALMFDVHFQINSLGSTNEYAK